MPRLWLHMRHRQALGLVPVVAPISALADIFILYIWTLILVTTASACFSRQLDFGYLFSSFYNWEVGCAEIFSTYTALLNNIKKLNIKVSRLARGVPAGGELDYLDEATLGQALSERTLVFDGIINYE